MTFLSFELLNRDEEVEMEDKKKFRLLKIIFLFYFYSLSIQETVESRNVLINEFNCHL